MSRVPGSAERGPGGQPPHVARGRRGSLAARLTLAFALTSAIPLLLVLPIASRFVGGTYEDLLRAEMASARDRATYLLERQQPDDVRRHLGELLDDSEMQHLLADASQLQRRLLEEDPLARFGLDALFVVTGDGRYQTNSLQIGNTGLVPPEILDAYERAQNAAVRRLETSAEGASSIIVLASARRGGLLVVVGDLVDDASLAQLKGSDGAQPAGGGRREDARDPAAYVLTPSAKPPFVHAVTVGIDAADPALASAEALARSFLVLEEAVAVEGSDPWRLLVLKGRGKLEAVRGNILGLFAALFALAFLIAGLTGYALAQRITRPVDRLVGAFAAVATGDLDVRVELEEGPQELVRMGEAFNNMAADLRDNKQKLLRAERIAAWEEIARRLAHEIKNPLSPIRLAIENCRKAYDRRLPEFDEIFKEASQAVLEEVEKLRRIVAEFSQFARLPKPVMTRQDLNEVVRNVLKLHQPGRQSIASPLPQGKEVTTEASLDPSLPPFLFDADQIHRVLVNLVQNALDASPEGGVVRLETRHERGAGGRAVVSVTDRGAGIAPDVRERLFQPYVTTKSHGTGLGLAISARIVEEHGGAIEATPAEPGTTFSVYLPLRIET